MKRFFMLLAAGLVALVAGCASTGTQSPAQIAAAVQVQVAKACAVVQPTLLSVQAMTVQSAPEQAVLAQLVKDNAAVCSGGATIDATTVASLINTSIPAAIQVVTLLPIDPAAKTGVQIGLIAFQTALSAAIAQYSAPAAAPAPASGAVSA
jgi:hypothetical protein